MDHGTRAKCDCVGRLECTGQSRDHMLQGTRLRFPRKKKYIKKSVIFMVHRPENKTRYKLFNLGRRLKLWGQVFSASFLILQLLSPHFFFNIILVELGLEAPQDSKPHFGGGAAVPIIAHLLSALKHSIFSFLSFFFPSKIF